MNDDRIQGILFNRSSTVDLARRRRHQRMLRRMLASKHRMQGWLTRPRAAKSPLVPDMPKPFIVVRGGKQRHADLYRLAKRFKDVDY